MKKQERGITLIALVITIIVLLILAGISIAMLTGENGILTKATEAKEKYAYKNAEEKVKLAVVEYQVKMREESLYNILSKIEGLEEIDPDDANEGPPYIVVVDGYEFEVRENENGEIEVEYIRKSNGIIPEIIRAEKSISGENVKILLEAKTEDEEGIEKVILIKNGVEIETKQVEGTHITEEFLLKGNGTYQVKVVGKNRKRAISQEISVTEVQVKISGTLKAGEVIEGSVLLTITGEATGTNIEKIEIYKGETTKIGEIPIEGEEMQVTKTYETANMVFYEETNYSAKIIASTKEWAFTNTVKCINSNTIRTRADLQKLSEVVEEGNNFRGKNIKVVEDINIQNVEMKPIGTPDVPFEGNFDGNFKTISNIVFRGFLHGYYGSNTGNAEYYSGLFGVVGSSGKIHGVLLSNVIGSRNDNSFEAGAQIGGLVGNNAGKVYQCGVTSGTVNQPRVPNTYGMGTDMVSLGGLVGVNSGTVKACFNRANVVSQYDRSAQESKMCSVGIVGYTEGSAEVRSCYNTGNVNVSGYSQLWSATTAYASSYITNVWSTAGVDLLWTAYREKTDYWSDSGERCRNFSK